MAVPVIALAIGAGCAAPAPRVPPRSASVPIAMPSPNLVLLAAERGVSLEDPALATRNDPPRGPVVIEAPAVTWVVRDVRDRQEVVNGRSRNDHRTITRQRAWSAR